MLENWKIKSQSQIFSSSPFNVIKKEYFKPHSQEIFDAFIVDTPNWANVIAINSKNQILMVKQFRFGTDKIELEIPGGCINKDEEAGEGIRRELKEETGYIAKRWTQIGVVDANPAIQQNKCYSFLAEEIVFTGQQQLDPDEIIEFEFVDLAEIDYLIQNGIITNTYIIAAFLWLKYYLEKREKEESI